VLRLMQLEEIEGLLRDLGPLVALQEARQPHFAARTVDWLRSFESVLEANRLAEAAVIAGLRSAIASASNGNVPPGLVTRGSPTRAKVSTLLAGQALQRAGELGVQIVAINRQRYSEAELVGQRLAAALRSMEIVIPDGLAISHGEWLGAIRSLVATRQELEPAMVHLEGLVGPNDALVILDRALAAGAVVVRPIAAAELDDGGAHPVNGGT
jgi:hypothetical protein